MASKLRWKLGLGFAPVDQLDGAAWRDGTAERIRDKVRASRMKGMWMGGCPPLGYEVKDRKLVENPADAAHVRWVFARFLEIGSGKLVLS